MKIEMLPVDSVICNDWNPNEMSTQMKEILIDNLERIGMVDPVLVTPVEDGKYRIVDGEHRYKVAVGAGHTEIPAVILEDNISVVEQKKQTIRMNQIKGQLSYDKFNRLVDTLRDTFKVEEGVLPFELGFESGSDMNLFYPTDSSIKKKQKEARASGDATVSLQHLYKITERYFKGERSGCFFIAHIDSNNSLLLEFDNEGLRLLEQGRASAANEGIDFEEWLLNAINKHGGVSEEKEVAG